MVTTLTGLYPGNTYKQLLQIGSGNVGITGSLQTVGDGDGNTCPLQLSTSAVKINNSSINIDGFALTVTSNTTLNGGTFSGTSSGTNTGDQTITLSGDVSGSGTGAITTTIGNSKISTAMLMDNNVTYSKFQNLSATTLLGNPTGSTANLSEIVLGSTLSFSDGTTLITGALSGDVSTSSNSFVTTIGNDKVTTAKILNSNVTYAKIQDLTNNTILGNTSGGAAAPSEISLPLSVANGGTGRASHTAYAVICGGTTSTGAQQSIASVGTSGYVLTSNGAGSLPTFQAATNGKLINIQKITTTGTYTPTSGTTVAFIELWGGGGGGGATNSATVYGATGGGGAYACGIVNNPTAVTVTIGAGGGGQLANAGAIGATGGSTTYNSTTIIAVGGSPANTIIAGAGGLSSSCTALMALSGGNGNYTYSGLVTGFVPGGGSSPKNIPAATFISGLGTGAVPNSGQGGSPGNQSVNAGAGATGLCIIWEYQ